MSIWIWILSAFLHLCVEKAVSALMKDPRRLLMVSVVEEFMKQTGRFDA